MSPTLLQGISCSCCDESETSGEIVCYCNQITRTEIEETINEKDHITISEVKNILRDTITSNYAELNPTGKCCHASFQAVIDEALSG